MLRHHPVKFYYTAPGNSHDFIAFIKENLSEHMVTLTKVADFKALRYSIPNDPNKKNTIMIYVDRRTESRYFRLRFYHNPVIIINYTDTAHGLDLSISMIDDFNEMSNLIIISMWSLAVALLAFDSIASRIVAFLLLTGIMYGGVRKLNPSFEEACIPIKQYFDRFLEAYFKNLGLSLNTARPTT